MNAPSTQLADLQANFRAISDRAGAVVARVGEDQIAVRPRPAAWSVAECLVHLKLSTEAYLPIWRKAFREARAAGLAAQAPFRLDLWGRFFVWFLEPPPKLRFPAPASFQPIATGPPAQVLSSFLASQELVLKMLEESDGLPLDRMKIESPFDRRVRYSVWASFCANAAHDRRHLWQAERTAEAIGK